MPPLKLLRRMSYSDKELFSGAIVIVAFLALLGFAFFGMAYVGR